MTFRSNPFAALYGALGGHADVLAGIAEKARAEALVDRTRRAEFAAMIAGLHAQADLVDCPATDSGEQFSDWGEHRASELARETRAQLATQLLTYRRDWDALEAEQEAELAAVAARMGWIKRGEPLWERIKNVAARQSLTEALADARYDYADVTANSKGRTMRERTLIARARKAARKREESGAQ